MSITEFDRYLRSRKPRFIIYRSEDQQDYDPYGNKPVITAKFTDHDIVLTNPNLTLILKGDYTTMRFDLVRCIQVLRSQEGDGETVHVICKGGINGVEMQYNLSVIY